MTLTYCTTLASAYTLYELAAFFLLSYFDVNYFPTFYPRSLSGKGFGVSLITLPKMHERKGTVPESGSVNIY